MRLPTVSALLRIATVLALAALTLMAWSVVDPTPLPLVVGLFVGQGLGTLSFAIFIFVFVIELRRGHVFRVGTKSTPPDSH